MRTLYHGNSMNSVPNDAELVRYNDEMNVKEAIDSITDDFDDIIGTNDISEIADGTVTGAIKTFGDDLSMLTQTLTAGETEVTFTDSRIDENSIFDFYASVYGIAPSDVSVDGTSVTVTFDAQDNDIVVGVRIYG